MSPDGTLAASTPQEYVKCSGPPKGRLNGVAISPNAVWCASLWATTLPERQKGTGSFLLMQHMQTSPALLGSLSAMLTQQLSGGIVTEESMMDLLWLTQQAAEQHHDKVSSLLQVTT